MQRFEVVCAHCRLREVSVHDRCVVIATTHHQVTGHTASIRRYGVPLDYTSQRERA